MKKWVKKGLIYRPDKSLYWQHSHAALPTRLHLGGNVYRIFFSSRDKNNFSYIGSFDLDIFQPEKIIDYAKIPVLNPGPTGFFDDCGVQPSCIVENDGQVLLYYIGWNRGNKSEIFYSSIGLATSRDGGKTFHKFSPSPVLDRSNYDPWMVSGPAVIIEKGKWRMWYISGQKLEVTKEGARSEYDIRYAESEDGINWKREGIICLPLEKGETNISRISIIREGNKYSCWFPVKKGNTGYRAGYAESPDGLLWERKDSLAGISVSDTGWDSEAIDKVEVISHHNNKYLLYNGNKFGYDGIGFATQE